MGVSYCGAPETSMFPFEDEGVVQVLFRQRDMWELGRNNHVRCFRFSEGQLKLSRASSRS